MKKKNKYQSIAIYKKDYLRLKKLCLIRKDEKGNPLKLSDLVELLINKP